MYRELMEPIEITVKDKKKVIKGTILRAALFARSKVVEVLTGDSGKYYLVYYDDSVICGGQLEQVKKGSFIHRAFQQGIVIESPHPYIPVLISNLSVSLPNKNKLFSYLQLQFSPREIACIATTLDSFFEKDQLIALIDKIFYNYRRNGNFIKSFQVLQILNDFAPSVKSVNERINAHEFISYRHFYDSSSLSSILNKDPLFVEYHCFKNRSNPEEHILLEEIYGQKENKIELLLLWLERIKTLKKMDSIEKYTEIALQFVSIEEWTFVLEKAEVNPFRVLPDTKKMIEKMIQKGNIEEAALYLFPYIADLPESFDEILNRIWEKTEAKFVATRLSEFINMMQQLVHREDPIRTEQKITQLAGILMEEFDLKTVYDKLLPIQKLMPGSAVLRKIAEMVKIVEDPDRMMELGDYYAEFHQFDQAIDCFSWEMELQPQNPSPVQKISKMYQHKGMAKEAAAYQKVYEQLKINMETGA